MTKSDRAREGNFPWQTSLPTEFYAPVGLFSDEDLSALGATYLGDRVYSPGFTSLYQITTGPLCRLFWNNGCAEPHSFESAWQEVNGRWKKCGKNYLSYGITGDRFLTVRWKPSTPQNWTNK